MATQIWLKWAMPWICGILFLRLSVIPTWATKCPVAQTSCCTAGSERIWVESRLLLSLLFKGSFLKTAEEGWMFTSTQPCQLAAHKHSSAHLGMLQCQNDHTQPASPSYVDRNAIIQTPVSHTEMCPWVLSIHINNVLQSIDFSSQEFKGIWIICLLVRNKNTQANKKFKKVLYFRHFSITLESKTVFWKINF